MEGNHDGLMDDEVRPHQRAFRFRPLLPWAHLSLHLGVSEARPSPPSSACACAWPAASVPAYYARAVVGGAGLNWTTASASEYFGRQRTPGLGTQPENLELVII